MPAPSPSPAVGASRLWCLLAGAGLLLGGVVGFGYESSFATGERLVADRIAGIFDTNGWHNLIHLAIGLLALTAAGRAPRGAAVLLGALLTVLGIWGLAVTDHGAGTLLDTVPVGSEVNLLHLLTGLAGIGAALLDRPPDLGRLRRVGQRSTWTGRARPGRPDRPGREPA
jgi:hypothetical protein